MCAARILEMNPGTILNWERGHTKPPVEAFPALLQFLGYDPFPEPKTLAERLVAERRDMGWSIRVAANRLGVNPGTWRGWEQGGVILFRRHRMAIARLLGSSSDGLDQEMGVRWNRIHRRDH